MRERKGGLSLESFIRAKNGAQQKKKMTAAKKVFIEKFQRKRKYEKLKKQSADKMEMESDGPTRFYDKFFSDLQQSDAPPKKYGTKKILQAGEKKQRPDPLYKAKQKAAELQSQRDALKQEKAKKQQEFGRNIQKRKKRHAKLSARTSSGQPFIRNSVKDILTQLQSSHSQ